MRAVYLNSSLRVLHTISSEALFLGFEAACFLLKKKRDITCLLETNFFFPPTSLYSISHLDLLSLSSAGSVQVILANNNRAGDWRSWEETEAALGATKGQHPVIPLGVSMV